MLRHKLDAQQQQLARLHSVTQRLTGATTAGALRPDSASSPKASATGGAVWPEPSLMSPTARGRPGTPQFAPWNSERPCTAAGAAGIGLSNAASNFSLAGGMFGVMPSAREDELLACLEPLAQAVCLLAIGQAAAADDAAPADTFSFQGNEATSDRSAHHQAGDEATYTVAAGSAGRGSREPSGGAGPHLARLKRLLQTGQIGRKLDWFNPTLLQKMVCTGFWRLLALA